MAEEKEQMNREDEILREFLNNNPSYPNYEDHTIIAYDIDGKGYSAKDLKDYPSYNNKYIK